MAMRLLRLPGPPTAAFAASDTQAIGVLSAAEAAGRPVPGELSVIGFGDIEMRETLPLEVVARRSTSAPRARSLSPQFSAVPKRAPP